VRSSEPRARAWPGARHGSARGGSARTSVAIDEARLRLLSGALAAEKAALLGRTRLGGRNGPDTILKKKTSFPLDLSRARIVATTARSGIR
jgi:hypothetical protein